MDSAATIELDDDPELGRTRLILGGRVAVDAARDLHHAAVAAGRAVGRVVVDCSAVERVDTAAAQILLALRRAVERDGRGFRVVGALADVAGDLALVGAADLA